MEIYMSMYLTHSQRHENRVSLLRRCALMLTGFSCQGARIIRIGRVRVKLTKADTRHACFTPQDDERSIEREEETAASITKNRAC